MATQQQSIVNYEQIHVQIEDEEKKELGAGSRKCQNVQAKQKELEHERK